MYIAVNVWHQVSNSPFLFSLFLISSLGGILSCETLREMEETCNFHDPDYNRTCSSRNRGVHAHGFVDEYFVLHNSSLDTLSLLIVIFLA